MVLTLRAAPAAFTCSNYSQRLDFSGHRRSAGSAARTRRAPTRCAPDVRDRASPRGDCPCWDRRSGRRYARRSWRDRRATSAFFSMWSGSWKASPATLTPMLAVSVNWLPPTSYGQAIDRTNSLARVGSAPARGEDGMDYRKFIAAQPRHGVAHSCAHRRRRSTNESKHGIAGRMAERVVQPFEPVKIDEEQRTPALATANSAMAAPGAGGTARDWLDR